MDVAVWLWAGFILFVTALLTLDLAVVHRKTRVIGTYEALAWTGFWITLAIVFNVGVYFLYEYHWLGMGLTEGRELDGREAALQFFTGYVIEKSLSVDNIFVIAMIFSYFRVPLEYQHRVLFWGIFGAIVLRGIMILGGLALIETFYWMIYVFGALLVFAAIRMLVQRHEQVQPEHNILIRGIKRVIPVSDEFHGDRFIVCRAGGGRMVTPLFLALAMVETADVVFAVDSIPAIIAVTREPFLVFTSNVFAILGLRSLYFVLATVMNRLRYIKTSLVFVLGFVGVKMLLADFYHMPTEISLAVIAAILIAGVLASLLIKSAEGEELVSPLADELERLVALSVKSARRVIVLVIGSSIVLVGLVMILTPGPAMLVIPAGLAILATEFVWARRLLRRLKEEAKTLSGNAVSMFRNNRDKGGRNHDRDDEHERDRGAG